MEIEKHYHAVIQYYEQSEISYREGWDLNHSMALHGGYWDEKAKTFRKALARLNEVVAEIVKLKPQDKVLDAGCGVGGSAIFMAKNIGCNVLGISLSEKQVTSARKNAEKYHLGHLTDFKVLDYTNTGLPSESFDVVWAVESVCHALDKSDFAKEAYRVLKPGGRLVLVDYFQKRDTSSEQEELEYRFFLDSFVCTHLDRVPLFENRLKEVGFQAIEIYDKTPNFLPNLPRLNFLGYASIGYSALLRFVGVKRKNKTREMGGRSAVLSAKLIKNGVVEYSLFCAIK